MKNYYKKLILLLTFTFILVPNYLYGAGDLAQNLAGYILLQVEDNGEAWYVDPDNLMRYYLGKPTDAYELMRSEGIGISNINLEKIPIGLTSGYGVDTDMDGLSDNHEIALGTDLNLADTDNDGFSDKEEVANAFNPLGPGTQAININFTKRFLGRIFLQVQSHGEAWYINPKDSKRYYLGQKEDAFAIMRELGLGINNSNLGTIIALDPGYDLRQLELLTHNLVNKERTNNGLEALEFNEELARVAREHSLSLAQENEPITGMELNCDFPIIHHEGLEFGFYNSDRLNNYNIFYFDKSGENIASMPGPQIMIMFDSRKKFDSDNLKCQNTRQKLELEFRANLEEEENEDDKIDLINNELEMRKNLIENEFEIEISSITWDSPEVIAQSTVEGWMNSPGHKSNILEVDFEEAGMGASYINGYFILTQNFIKRAECGYEGGVCCEKTGYYPYCFIDLECNDMLCE